MNAVAHGFTATLKPPADLQERELYESLLCDFVLEFLPCGRVEGLALEEIVVLELRRIKIQEAQMGDLELDEAGLKRTLLLSRYETETLNKLDKKRKLLAELQAMRAQRRGLALESALVQEQVAAAKRQLGEDAAAIARRSLGRELHDLVGLAPQAADQTAAVMMAPSSSSAPASGRTVGGGGFRSFASPRLPSASPLSPADADGTDAAAMIPAPKLPYMIPGPVWNPWRGASPEQLEAWNDELLEYRKAQLRAELAELEAEVGPPEELVRMFPEHYAEEGEGEGNGEWRMEDGECRVGGAADALA
jgi:hypothetical protein